MSTVSILPSQLEQQVPAALTDSQFTIDED